MTLIAAFKCYDGAVIVADSQETLGVYAPQGFGDYRCRVDKIRPQRVGSYWLVIGGAGDGDLVDGFTEQLADQVELWPAGLDAKEIKARIRASLLKYNRAEVAASNLTDTKLDFIICIKQLEPGIDPVLFRAGKSVTRIDGYALIGWEDGIYKHFVDRLYKYQGQAKDTRDRNTGNRALLVGLYVMMLGRNTSNVIGPPTVAIHARSSSVVEIPRDSIELIEGRLESFARILEDVTLWCPDPDVPNHEFPGYLDNIEKQLLELREQYFGPITGSVLLQPPDLQEEGDESA